MTKVLIVASGLSAQQVNDYDYKANGWTIVAVNNAWQVTEDWDWWIAPPDYKGCVPLDTSPPKRKVKNYSKQLGKYGGQRECGFAITLNAGYWALGALTPTAIGFLGADMNYTPDPETGHTHIYGVGFDIEANGESDPDRMVRMYAKEDDDYLSTIYNRLVEYADKQQCKIYNFSTMEPSRLPYPKARPQDL